MENEDFIKVTIPVEKSMIKSHREQLYLDIVKGLNDKLIIPRKLEDGDKEVFNDREGFILNKTEDN